MSYERRALHASLRARSIQVLLVAAAMFSFSARAQTTAIPGQSESLRAESSALPEAPSAALGPAAGSAAVRAALSLSEASPYQSVIEPGQVAPPLDAHDKMMIGLKRSFSPLAASGWLFSAGYGQLDGTPHYGSDRGAFGERLGAAALRDVSEAVLTDGVFAAAFHQDPRYYRLGDRRSIAARIGHAALQPLLTRTDTGHSALNVSLLAGTLSGSALTNAYYPKPDRSAGQTLETFGFSMEGSVVGNLIREFLPDAGKFLHPAR
jgi:hypothetical protein